MSCWAHNATEAHKKSRCHLKWSLNEHSHIECGLSVQVAVIAEVTFCRVEADNSNDR